MTQDDSFPPGARIGNYAVMSRLGRGGMGVVYLVQQVYLHKRFALKVLNPELAAMPEFVQVFRQEARTLASLHHPNIVQVHDFGEHEGRGYFLMDYVEGGTVEDRRRLRGGRLNPSDTLELLRGLSAGLGYAHGLGIAHRDLKPENFLIDAAGVPKITDFGLATLVARPASETIAAQRGDTFMHFAKAAADAPALTGGTAGYMAPELREGAAGDARSDVYAMGVIAYQLLTGGMPAFPLTPLSAAVPGIDPRWDDILGRCLAADPAARYRDGGALALALEPLSVRESAVTRRPDWLWALPVPVVSVVAFLAALALHDRRPESSVVAVSRAQETAPVAPIAAVAPVAKPDGLMFSPADAALGSGLVLKGRPGRIVGWRPSSVARWDAGLGPGRYRVDCDYALSVALGARPVRVSLRVGEAVTECYLPVTSSDTEVSRVRLGEIELGRRADRVEFELIQGADAGVDLRMAALFFERIP